MKGKKDKGVTLGICEATTSAVLCRRRSVRIPGKDPGSNQYNDKGQEVKERSELNDRSVILHCINAVLFYNVYSFVLGVNQVSTGDHTTRKLRDSVGSDLHKPVFSSSRSSSDSKHGARGHVAQVALSPLPVPTL